MPHQARTPWLREAAFLGLCLAASFVWDVAYGLIYDHLSAARGLSVIVAYFAVPTVLCAVMGYPLRRWLKVSDTDGAATFVVLSCLGAPAAAFFPVLYFECAVLDACIG